MSLRLLLGGTAILAALAVTPPAIAASRWGTNLSLPAAAAVPKTPTLATSPMGRVQFNPLSGDLATLKGQLKARELLIDLKGVDTTATHAVIDKTGTVSLTSEPPATHDQGATGPSRMSSSLLDSSNDSSLTNKAGQSDSGAPGTGGNYGGTTYGGDTGGVPAPITMGTGPTNSQGEAVFSGFVAGAFGYVGNALAGPPGGFVGGFIGLGVAYGAENYHNLPLPVQLGISPYTPW